MFWDAVELRAGRYNWANYDKLAASLEVHGLRPLFILDYGNPLYSSGFVEQRAGARRAYAPATPTQRAAYAAWSRAAALRYQRYDPIWEIWNEPEHDGFWPPVRNSPDYLKLATDACSAIRSAVKDATVVGPAAAMAPTSSDPLPELLVGIAQSPLLHCLTAISLHPYLDENSIDSNPSVWERARELFRTETPDHYVPEMISSEWGRSSTQFRGDGRRQADYVAKMLVFDSYSGVPLSVWYDWRDDADNPSDIEANFGLIAYNGAAKDALLAMEYIEGRLRLARPECRMTDSASGLVAYVFRGPGEPGNGDFLVSWSLDTASPLNWKALQVAQRYFDDATTAEGTPTVLGPSSTDRMVFIHLRKDGHNNPAETICSMKGGPSIERPH